MYMDQRRYSMAAKFYKMAADQGVRGALYHFHKATKLAAENGEAAVVWWRGLVACMILDRDVEHSEASVEQEPQKLKNKLNT